MRQPHRPSPWLNQEPTDDRLVAAVGHRVDSPWVLRVSHPAGSRVPAEQPTATATSSRWPRVRRPCRDAVTASALADPQGRAGVAPRDLSPPGVLALRAVLPASDARGGTAAHRRRPHAVSARQPDGVSNARTEAVARVPRVDAPVGLSPGPDQLRPVQLAGLPHFRRQLLDSRPDRRVRMLRLSPVDPNAPTPEPRAPEPVDRSKPLLPSAEHPRARPEPRAGQHLPQRPCIRSSWPQRSP